MKRLLTASLVLAFFVVLVGSNSQHRPTTALAAYQGDGTLKQASQAIGHRHWCVKTFRIAQVARTIRKTYRGTRNVTRQDRRRIAGMEACLRNPIRTGYVMRINRNAKRAWNNRRHPWSQAVASWYDDAGAVACFHAGMGVAHKTLPCGTRVQFSYNGRTATAVVDDRGPYIGGREWDLNQNTAGALGFSGVDTVAYRILK